ncbi:MAG: signal recognition particle-docking protein FtsY [Candidatus Babeliales bacterium]|jgi:fused signal recognition particle receptor
MFNFIKNKFKKIYTTVTSQISSLFSGNKFDENFLKELSAVLIKADTGVHITEEIVKTLSTGMRAASITTLEQAREALGKELVALLQTPQTPESTPRITLIVGVNGSGKTTFVAKYANLMKKNGKRVLVIAGDTFRAAATEQLCVWASSIGVTVHVGKDGQDPAAVVYDGCKKFVDESYDCLIIDTAGRLQTKTNLMRELEKIKRTINKQLPGASIATWLTIDAMLGQNSLAQADLFHQATPLDGIVLTKLDGTGKGGIVFAITQKLKIPIVYVTYGERIDDVGLFEAQEYVNGLLRD